MELSLKTVHLQRNAIAISQNAGGDRLVMLSGVSGAERLHFYKVPQASGKSSAVSLAPCGVVKALHARAVVLDASGSWVFVFGSGAAPHRLSVRPFILPDRESECGEMHVDLSFKHPIFAVHDLRFRGAKATSVVVAVVSTAGELALVHVAPSGKASAVPNTATTLPVQHVLATSPYNRDSLVVYAAPHKHDPAANPVCSFDADADTDGNNPRKHRTGTLAFYVVRYSLPAANDPNSAKVVISSPVPLPVANRLLQFHSISSTSSHRTPSVKATALAQPAVLAASVLPHCAMLLLSDGSLHVLAPRKHVRQSSPSDMNLDAWFPTTSTTTKHCSQLIRSSQLPCSPLPKKARSFGSILPMGNTADSPPSHVLICYNDTISIWDTTYFVMHGMVRNTNPLRQVCISSLSTPLVCEENGLRAIDINSNRSSSLSSKSDYKAPSLARAAAIMRKQAAEQHQFLSSVGVSSPKHPPSTLLVHPHVDAHKAITTAAHSGGSMSALFDPVLQVAAETESANLRAILTAASAKDLIALKLTSQPSSRVAATFVTRCLIALARRPVDESCDSSKAGMFVQPLVDMLATGAVSSNAVVKLFNSWPRKQKVNLGDDDDEEDEDEEDGDNESDGDGDSVMKTGKVAKGKMRKEEEPVDFDVSSIVDAVLLPYLVRRQWLLQNPKFIPTTVPFNVLEATILRVPDLVERDIVQVLLFTVQVCRLVENSHSNAGRRGSSKNDRIQNKVKPVPDMTRGRSLLDKIVRVSVNSGKAVSALREVPFDDVLVLLHQLERVLVDADGCAEDEVDQSVEVKGEGEAAKGQSANRSEKDATTSSTPSDYRGKDQWLDQRYSEFSPLCGENALAMSENDFNALGNVSNHTNDKNNSIPDDEDTTLDTQPYVEWMSWAIDAHFTNLIMDPQGQGRALVDKLLGTVQRAREHREALSNLEGMSLHLLEKRKTPSRSGNPFYKVVELSLPANFTLL